MSVKSDRWIRRMAGEKGMIELQSKRIYSETITPTSSGTTTKGVQRRLEGGSRSIPSLHVSSTTTPEYDATISCSDALPTS